MLFYKLIRQNPFLNRWVIRILRIVIRIFRFFIPAPKSYNKNVVIIAVHRLGDAIFTIPAIEKLIHHYKQNFNLFLVCMKNTIPIYQLKLEGIEYLGVDSKDFFYNSRISKGRIRKLLSGLRPEIIFDLTGNFTSASILIRTKANKITGLNDEYYSTIYTHYSKIRAEPYYIYNYLDAIQPLVESNYIYSGVKAESEGKYILIHPF